MCMFMYVDLKIVLSTTIGNLGSYLTNDVSVYISRDGGITWQKVNIL